MRGVKIYDVVIVGAGPAGLKCAEILSKNNKKVLVLEKNPKIGEKVCGGGLTVKDLNLKIPNRIIQKKFKKMIISTPSKRLEIKSDKVFLATILREDLGKWMLKKSLRSGAIVKFGSEVTKISQDYVAINNKTKIKYNFLIGADGSSSLVRKYLGIKTDKFLQAFHYLPKKKFNNLELHIGPNRFGHYVWVFPYKNFASIGTGDDFKEGKVSLGFTTQKIKENFDCWCKDKFNTKSCKFQAATINYDYQGYEFGNIFLIGDAAGMASGLTGEGIYNAIKSGEDVAYKILNKNYPCQNISHILKVKKFEETILRILEKNRDLTALELETIVNLLKVKFISKEFVDYLRW